jgi:chemotaxis protein CheC
LCRNDVFRLNYEADYDYTRQSFFGDMDGKLVTLMSRCGCELIVNDLQQSTGDTQDVVSLEDSTLDKVLTHLDELM